MHEAGERWVIESVRVDGSRFRPSDWIERISASLASFGLDHRLRYDSEVQPCIIQGQKCLMVGKALSQRDPELLAYIMKFAADNHLRVQEERRTLDLPSSIERRGDRQTQ